MARSWEPDGELIRCKTHKVSFGKLETCPDCKPSALLTADVAFSHPTGCVGSDEHEQWHMRRADVWAKRADDILSGAESVGEDCDATTIAVKAEEVARKHRVHAVELAKQRERKAYIAALRKEREKIRKGWGSAN